LRFRSLYQGQIAVVLAALAPRYQPSLTAELKGLATKLSAQLPAGVAQMSEFTAARLRGDQTSLDTPETSIPLAISNGDFQEATTLINDLKDDDLKKTYLQVLIKAQAKSLLASSQLPDAISVIRRIEDPSARLVLYLDAIKLAHKKGDPALSASVLSEARTLVPEINRNGLHVRALLSFVSLLTRLAPVDESSTVLDSAVAAINSLPRKSDESAETKSPSELAWEQLNDPRTLVDAQELEDAFSALGTVDMERAIIGARKIEIKPVQLIARLEAIEPVIKSDARRRKTGPATRRSSRSAATQK
jgi:hypothetical protein